MAGKDIPDSVASRMHLASILGSFGYLFTNNRTHAVEFRNDQGECVYVKTTGKLSVVLDPRLVSASTTLNGRAGYETRNSNFSDYPRKDRTGDRPEKYGIAFDLGKPEDAVGVMKAKEKL